MTTHKNMTMNGTKVQNPRRCLRHDKIVDMDVLYACSTKLIVGLGHTTEGSAAVAVSL